MEFKEYQQQAQKTIQNNANDDKIFLASFPKGTTTGLAWPYVPAFHLLVDRF
jgi:hypothetical protein